MSTNRKDTAPAERTMSNGEKAAAIYDRVDKADGALTRYLSAIGKDARQALRKDEGKFDAVTRMFYSARSQAETDRYMGMSPDELAALAAKADSDKLLGEG